MKVKIGKEKNKPKYPRLMRSQITGMVALVYLDGTALVLESNRSMRKVGSLVTDLDPSGLIDFNGSVTLSND